ncbi:MAG TPA: hypothetical protein VKF81_03715, partial [Blastocatellia bacterium]|nr:hypothetical protein [Blastocatellia bacterium]
MTNNAATQVRFGDWISEGWKMFTEQWKGWVKLSLAAFLVLVLPTLALVVVMYIWMFVTMLGQQHPGGAPPQMPLATFVLFYVAILAMVIVLMPLAVLAVGGAYRAAFKQLRGGQIEFRDLFSARDCYWRLLGAALLHLVLVSIGSLLCVIPGLIVSGLL